MTRMTRRERKICEAAKLPSYEGLKFKEMKEITDFIQFYNDYKKIAYKYTGAVRNYVISYDTERKYRVKHKKKYVYTYYVTLLTDEAKKKGFESLLTYVRFLKLTFLEEDGVYHVVSEDEQSHMKIWVHKMRSFENWGICIELATPGSTHVLEVATPEWATPESTLVQEVPHQVQQCQHMCGCYGQFLKALIVCQPGMMCTNNELPPSNTKPHHPCS